ASPLELPHTTHDSTQDDDAPDDDDAERRIASWAIETGVGLPDLKKRLETALIREALVLADGNVTHAARLLDMKRPRLSQLINASPELEALKTRLARQQAESQ
ncbi:MAG: hypothetical protein EA398_16970, partial [Deltaproteobacteria bacterium]